MRARLTAAVQNRRFRWLVVALIAIPVAVAYVVDGVVEQLPTVGVPGTTDFAQVYYAAARALLEGRDPYTIQCHGYSCEPILGPFITNHPPAMSWVLQPLAALDFRTADGIALAASNLVLLLTIALSLRAARVRDRQLLVVLAALMLSWGPPLNQVQNRQPQLLIACLEAAWLWGYAAGGREALAGVALGLSAALKLQTGPLVLLVAWRRRWRMLIAAAVAGAALWAVASPWLLPEYLTRVLPRITGGNGYWFNVALAGSIDRVLQPDSFWGRTVAVSPLVGPLALVAGAAAAAVTARVAGRKSEDPEQRLVEASAATSVTLLLAPLLWFGHLVLLLPALVAALAVAVRRRDPVSGGLALAAWALTGPLFQLVAIVIATHPDNHALVYPLGHVSLAGQLLLWAALLRQARHRTIRA